MINNKLKNKAIELHKNITQLIELYQSAEIIRQKIHKSYSILEDMYENSEQFDTNLNKLFLINNDVEYYCQELYCFEFIKLNKQLKKYINKLR